MMDILTKYYGIDWAATISMFFMIYYIGNKKRQGFLFGVLADE